MNRNQRIAMAENDLTVKRLGQILDKHPNHLTNVFGDRIKTPHLRKEMAKILGKSEDYLWPEQDAS